MTEHIGFLAARLEARGHSVSILAPSSADREQLATDHVYRLGNIVRVPYHGSFARITLSLGLRQKVRAILERETVRRHSRARAVVAHIAAGGGARIRNLRAVRGVVNKIDVVRNGYGRTAGPDSVIGRA